MKKNETVYVWISLIGFVVFLIGLYGTVRTAVNMYAFKSYPPTGVYSFSNMVYGPRKEDCLMSNYFPMPVDPSGKPVKLTQEEEKQMKEQQKMQYDSCIQSAESASNQAKVNDISQSLLFLVIGGGILAFRKFLFS